MVSVNDESIYHYTIINQSCIFSNKFGWNTTVKKTENIFTNTVTGMKKMASGDMSDPFLGGQNPYEVYYECAAGLNVLPAGSYDRKMADNFRDYMLKFFTDKMDEDEAMDSFYQMVDREYPELTVDY